MANKLRVGVIGTGFGATVHIPAFQSEDCEVVAVCARREEHAKEAAQKFGISNVFTDFQTLAEWDGVDAISIASPPPMHFPMAMAALDNGKHVVCEKPFTTDVDLAHAMWAKAKASGLTHMVAHEFRFHSGRQYVKELLDQGYIGQLHMGIATLVNGPRGAFHARPLSERDDAKSGFGLLAALGSHYIDAFRHWFGEVESVSGQVRTLFPDRTDPKTGASARSTADDTFQFTLTFVNGGSMTMVATNAAPFGPGARIDIYGREGALSTPHKGPGMNPPSHGAVLGAKVGEDALKEMRIPQRLEPLTDDRDDRLFGFRLLVRQFKKGIETGTSPAPNFYDGYKCQQVLDAVRESARTGKVITLPRE